MAIVVPLSTVHTPAGFTAADILQVMADQFGVSTKFVIDVTATGGVTNGFSVRSLTDIVPRYIFRRTGAQNIAVSYQPEGGCSDIGDTVTPPTVGTPGIWSDEKIWTISASMGTGSIVLMSEVDDAFFVMCTTTVKTSFLDSLAIGRHIDLDDAGDVALGRDGLSLFAGLPGFITSGAYWWNNLTTHAARYNIIRLATSTYGSSIGNVSGVAAGTDTIGGFVRPTKAVLTCNTNGSASPGFAQTLLLKYIRISGSSHPPRTVVFTNNLTNQGWMHVSPSTAATTVVIPWNRTVVPD